MEDSTGDKTFDVQLIPEFDGSHSQSVTEWFEKLELVCRLRKVADVACVIPLRLSGGAFAVYLHLPDEDKKSAAKVKAALLAAFAKDPFAAYDEFSCRKLRNGESPDVFLADLRRLASLFGGVPEKAMMCAFIAGLPESVRRLLRASSRLGELSLNQVLVQARAVLSDERPAIVQDSCMGAKESWPPANVGERRCYECDEVGHFARDCMGHRKANPEAEPRARQVKSQGFVDVGKRVTGGGICASLLPTTTNALPTVRMMANGVYRSVLVDTGCSKCIAHVTCCENWRKEQVTVTTVSGQSLQCIGVSVIRLQPPGGSEAAVEAIVTDKRPLGFELILGMNGIAALGGVTVRDERRINFGVGNTFAAAVCNGGEIRLEERDFTAIYNPTVRAWTARWKWTNGMQPTSLRNKVQEYPPSGEVREKYEEELGEWIKNGWLVPYDESKWGPAKGLIPLMAVSQDNKGKVRPVMDFRELNSYIEAFTADSDVCAQKLREWRKQGANVSVVDLKRAYLQIHVDRSLWPYQTVMYKGRRYCLTRLGFGLNVAPLIMKAVLNCVLSQDSTVKKGTSAYIDDILVNEDVVKATRVERHLARFGLTCKPHERVANGTRVLGLRVWGERGNLFWRRDAEVCNAPERLTRRSVFSFCGKLTGHFPVCGWLRVAAAFIKRKANEVTTSWDQVIENAELESLINEVASKVRSNDPVGGRWNVSGEKARVWVDASSLAHGVVIEVGGCIIEDAAWLRSDEASHINMAELDAVIKGLNFAISWGMKNIELMTDSTTVHRWVSDGLSGKARLKTKAASEMLIRRRVDIVLSLVNEYNLELVVTLVNSASNKADVLTRVPQRWLHSAIVIPSSTCAAVVQPDVGQLIAEIHHKMGHPGVRRTLYFVKRINPMVSKRQVRQTIVNCDACQSVDPAPVKWKQGCLGVKEIWQRVAMDITHYRGMSYLSLVDCGPSRFAVWRPLRLQSSEAVIRELEAVFFERGPPEELLTDNDTAFRSKMFLHFAERWDVHIRFRCAYVPSGNGIVERCHRSVKVIAARKGCSIAEAVYLYNVTPRNGHSEITAPANAMYKYKVRIRNIDRASKGPPKLDNPYGIGDPVWVKPHGIRCDSQYTRGTVTKILSSHAVEIDGVPRHVRDIRRRVLTEEQPNSKSAESSSDDGMSTPVLATWRVKKTLTECDGGPGEVSGQDVRRDDREQKAHCESSTELEQNDQATEGKTDSQRTNSDGVEAPSWTPERIPRETSSLPSAMSNVEIRRSSRPRRNRVCPYCDL
uniref:Uncharacterized protein n=1 Tax=Trichuris muris TaxID=70415 RepID=A0A5S6Q4C2_TRIMR